MDIDTGRPLARRARILSPLVGVVAVAGLLTGCTAPAEPAPTVTQTVTAPSDPSPTAPPSASPVAGADTSGIGGVELGAPYDEAVAAAGADPAEACPWVASSDEDGYTLTIQRAEIAEQDPPVVDLVQVSAPPADVEGRPAVGPLTAEGIGVGSRMDQALAAYPDAVATEGVGDRRYLAVETDGGAGSVFLTSTAGTDTIWAMTVTSLDEPPYESCA